MRITEQVIMQWRGTRAISNEGNIISRVVLLCDKLSWWLFDGHNTLCAPASTPNRPPMSLQRLFSALQEYLAPACGTALCVIRGQVC